MYSLLGKGFITEGDLGEKNLNRFREVRNLRRAVDSTEILCLL